MGLLGRRHTHHQVSTLKKNQNNDALANPPSQSSLIAAQAAASLFQNSNNSAVGQQTTTPAAKNASAGLRRTTSVNGVPTATRPKVVVHPSVKKSPLPPKPVNNNTNQNHNAQANIENLSLNEEPPKLTRARSRSPAPTSRRTTPPNHTVPSATSIQAIASAAAKSAANSTADLLSPPNPSHTNKVYPSSPSISLGSSNSLDSAPFSLKPPNFQGTNYRSTSDVASISEAQLHPPKFYFDSDQNGSDYFDAYDRSSIRSSSAGSDYLSTPKYQRGSGGSSSHLALDTIPSRIDEHENEYYESDPNDYDYDHEGDYSDSDLPQSQIEFNIDRSLDPLTPSSKYDLSQLQQSTRPSLPMRKPPSSDIPPLQPAQNMHLGSSSSLLPNPAPPMSRRNTSPKRKPPPGSPHLNQYDTDSVLNSGLDGEEDDDDDDPLPQYPLSVEAQELRRRHRHHHGFRKNAKNIFKKGMKVTAAANPTSYLSNDNEEPKFGHFRTTMRKEKKKSVFNEDKPWKHHNDREYITEQERKRYDGVWVANKGLYMNLVDPATLKQGAEEQESENVALKASMLSTKTEPSPMQETSLMLNLVVRDLWSRSRLPPDLLRQVWELVDTRKDGTIERKSFIIGMWLVDQCLYGRKLPKQLDNSVWNSVSQLGVNVVIKPKKRK